MNIVTAASMATEAVETAVAFGTRAYVIGSEVFTISAIMWCLSVMSNMIEKTYNTGLVVGEFYKTHVHEYTLKAVALVILLCVLAYEGAILVYDNREEIVYNTKTWWKSVEELFTYKSPVLA